MPALTRSIVHNKHMVGKGFAKTQLGFVGGLCLGGSGLGDLDVQHFKTLPYF
jgi:hypothetical protein